MTNTLSKEEFQRYSRHIILPQFGIDGQAALKHAKVLVVGAGGLGIPVLLYLAAAGVGKIGIVDYDTIEFSNLQRQVIYKTSEVGQSKVEKAGNFIKEQNPGVNLEVHKTWIDSSNALEIIGDYDLIIDGSDNFPTRYLLNDAAIIKKIPYVYGSIYRFEGQVSVFNYQDGPNYRDLFPSPPAPEIVPNCSEGGVLGVLPGIVGSLQALESIKVLTGVGEVLTGKLLTIDTLHNQYRTFKFKKRTGSQAIVELIDYDQFCNPKTVEVDDIESILPTELSAWRKLGKSFVLIDVREEYEFEIANLGGLLIPMNEVEDKLTMIPMDLPVVVHCRSGKRSSEVIRKLKTTFGYKNLLNLEGGLLRYASDVDNTLTIY